jgi:AcrR family transcriptional regulator
MIDNSPSAGTGLKPGKVMPRREAKVAAILESAWNLAREHGIAGVSLHALAREVGMRQPSLYAYFDSKSELYDAMFADGNRRLLQQLDLIKLPRDPRAALKKFLAEFVALALEDPARYELLFERRIPGFTPSPTSYRLAEAVLGRAYEFINKVGVTQQGDIDCMIAMVAGLMEAQLSNDPGGNRWIRHLNRLVDLYVDDVLERSSRT